MTTLSALSGVQKGHVHPGGIRKPREDDNSRRRLACVGRGKLPPTITCPTCNLPLSLLGNHYTCSNCKRTIWTKKYKPEWKDIPDFSIADESNKIPVVEMDADKVAKMDKEIAYRQAILVQFDKFGRELYCETHRRIKLDRLEEGREDE